ncbi:MAG: hypothetical protein GY934_16580 [Gammaproteobacteria bacterium]|nr:hypothetical protein [Gammaproteobacteria bacterium]
MKKSIVIIASLVSTVVFSTAVFAGYATPDISTDLMYGNSPVKASLGQAYVNKGPVQQDIETDLLYGSSGFGDASPFKPWEPQLGVQTDISTDLLYGS